MRKTRKYQLATIRDYYILRQITAATELQRQRRLRLPRCIGDWY